MKKLMVLTIIIVSAATAFGQGRHSIKIGVGANLNWNLDKGYNHDKSMGTIYTLGTTLHIDYGYRLNKYIELGVNAFSLTNRQGEYRDEMGVGALAKFVFTPLPKVFRYIRLGVGAGWINTKHLRTDSEAVSSRLNEFACDYAYDALMPIVTKDKGYGVFLGGAFKCFYGLEEDVAFYLFALNVVFVEFFCQCFGLGLVAAA